MNTLQVSSIIKLDKRTSKIYLGTFAFDKLPTIVNYPSCLIVNTQKSNQLGEHWLAIYYSKNKSISLIQWVYLLHFTSSNNI